MFLAKTSLATLLCAVALLAGASSAHAAAPAQRATAQTDRPAAFVNFMLLGAMVHEDRDNRLTFRERRAFITPGLALRAGGVVRQRHLVGALFQATWRSSRTLLDQQGDDRKWGAISSYFIGPEYRYMTDFGLYAGGALGFAYTFADNHVGGGGAPDCSLHRCLKEHLRRSDDQGVPGVGVRAVVGYEYRVRRNLAVNVEAFGGVLHGDDEQDEAMTTPSYGLAVGVGF